MGHFVRRDNRAGQADWTNLYVKGLPESWDDAKLKEEFEKHGRVTRWAPIASTSSLKVYVHMREEKELRVITHEGEVS